MIWFTSDTHFGHANIIKYSNRPFWKASDGFTLDSGLDPDVHLMNKTLIDNINELVKQDDVLWHLGDFSFRDHRSYRERINCRNINLILGNHDKLHDNDYKLFSSVQHFRELKVEGRLLVLCHYGMRVWNKSHHGSIHLYAHSHGSLPPQGRSMDVGVDCWKYKPLSLDFIIKHMDNIPVHNVDHHEARDKPKTEISNFRAGQSMTNWAESIGYNPKDL